MTTFFPPALRQLLWAWRQAPERLEESAEAARTWVSDAQASLERLKSLILWREDHAETLHQAGLDLEEAHRMVWERLGNKQSEEKAAAWEQLVERYFGHLLQLQFAEEQLPAYSPMLALDQAIRVAFNLHQGRCQPVELQMMLPTAHGAVLHARMELELRRRLFEESPWELDEPVYQMEGGIGALAQFLESGSIEVLEEAIQLLGVGSTAYVNGIEEIRRSIAPRYSSHDELECWLRLQDYPYDLGEMVQYVWGRLSARLEQFSRAVQMARQAGLGVAEPELIDAARPLHDTAVQALEKISVTPLEPAQQAELLVGPWDALVSFEAELQPRVRQLQQSLDGAPGMIDLLQLLCQAEAGQLAPWVLRAELEQRMSQQQATQESVEGVPELDSQIGNLLGSHSMAYQRMLLFGEDADRRHLSDGWKLLALTLPPLLQFDAEVRKQTSKGGKSGQQVTCVRCGAVQYPAKSCSSCNAALPQLQIDDVRYQDISGEEVHSSASVAENLAALIEGIPFGNATWEQVRGELASQLDALTKVRDRFEREVLKMMGRDAAFDAYCQFFVVKLGQLSQALVQIGEYAERGQLVAAQSSLGAYRELHEELQEFQKKISEGTAKT